MRSAVFALVLTGLACAGTAAADVTRPACIVAEPPEWSAAIAGSGIDTGGVSTTARAVAPGGEVLAVRDNGDTRDLLLIGTDRSVRELYAVPEPNTFDIGYAGIDDRWIVFALNRIPRNSNGVLPTAERIEVMDRADGSIRTVAATEQGVLEAVSLRDGRVFWLTKADYAADDGVVRSFDPSTGGVLEEPGLEQVSVGTDGAASGWIVGVEDGGTGVGYRSPDAGSVVVTGLDLRIANHAPEVDVFGPFVILGKGLPADVAPDGRSVAIVVDTRTGAVTGLTNQVVDAHGGVLAVNIWTGPGKGDFRVGVLRDDLTPLEC